MAVLEVCDLTKSYGGQQVLRGVSFSLEKGEVLSIIGSSGSGKTTLLRCLNFLETPQSGSIAVNGEVLFDAAQSEKPTPDSIRRKRLHFGLVFQSFNLFPQYTVLQNITLAPNLRAKESAKQRGQKAEPEAFQKNEERALALLARVGLTDKKDSYPYQLSGGQQQRVAIARALVLRPAVLLLDEPFSALDAKIRGQMREELKRIQREAGLTVIFVTHDQEEAMAISDRIAVMNQGAIEQLDSPTEIYDNPHSRFVAGFIGEMNFLDEGGAVLAVRPEDIALRSASGAGMARIESVMPLGHYTQIILVRADGARLKVFIPKEQALGYIPGQTADYSFTRFKQFGAAQASA